MQHNTTTTSYQRGHGQQNTQRRLDYDHLPNPGSFFPLSKCAYLNATCFEAAFRSVLAMGELAVEVFRSIGMPSPLGVERTNKKQKRLESGMNNSETNSVLLDEH